MNKYNEYLKSNFGISDDNIAYCCDIEKKIRPFFEAAEEVAEFNQLKVLHAMQKNNIGESHFCTTTGYGYNDLGRDMLESVYSDVFKTELTLVRPQLISGTNALFIALSGNLRPGDEIYSPAGDVYETLKGVIGIRKERGSLSEFGITYKQSELLPDGSFDLDAIKKDISEKTKIAIIQRSKGYIMRESFSVKKIAEIIRYIKKLNENIICLVDNCYGEFTDFCEPSEFGADLIVGSLIKNPGGGLAATGGYISGKSEYVENAASRLTAPGLGREVGASLGVLPSLFQGFFMAPQVVCASIKGAIFAAAVFNGLGFKTLPNYDEKRADIVQAIEFKTAERAIAFCQGIQAGSPVDSFVTPMPWDMPGYASPVIMASGAFVQGSSIELSADAPITPPYNVFMQGGLSWDHAKTGIIIALQKLIDKGLVDIHI